MKRIATLLILLLALLAVASAQIQIQTASLPDGSLSQGYSATVFTTGATSTVTCGLLTQGTPPPGLSFFASSTTCVLSGVPTQTGTYSFTLYVQDQQQHTATANYTVRIFNTGGSGGVSITTTSVPNGSVGLPYSFQFQATAPTTSESTFYWSLLSGTLPGGLNLSSGGVLSGTPTTGGTFNFQVLVTLGDFGNDSHAFSMTVTSGPLRIIETSLPSPPIAVQGQPYSVTLHASGGAPNYTWTLGGTDAQGLTIDSTSGVISGTPGNAGNFVLPVTVSDAAGNVFTFRFPLFVATPLSVITTTLPNGTNGSSYAQTLQAGGGQSPYLWAVASGNLPPGLSLNRTSGLISGTPTSDGAFSFTVQVTDSGSRTASRDLSITVGQTVLITTTSLPDASVGVAYTPVQLTASGGQTPYTWTGQGLPAGLTLSSAGVLSGTPTAIGSASVSVTVTDAQRSAATKTFSLQVVSPLSITTGQTLDGSVNQAYTQSFGASGGTPPYTWSVFSGTLPPGLILSASNAIVSGTPTQAGSFNFTLQVRDVVGQTASKSFVIAITDPLVITTGNLTGGFLAAFSQTLQATGGTSPYTWGIAGGALPTGLTLNTSTGTITGNSAASGTAAVTFLVTDSRGRTATKQINITIALPPVAPTITIGTSGGPAPGPNQQPVVALSIGSAYPSEITGTLTLAFAPVSGADDPNVRFNNGLRTLNFIVRAGQTAAIFPSVSSGAVLTGTVAGTITLTARMTAADVDVTPNPVPTQRITIDALPPVITSVQLVQVSGGVNVVVTGYSTTREITSGLFHFAAASGSNLQTSDFTVPLGPSFVTFYASAGAAATGSQFTLTMPFTVSGSTASIVSVSVTLTNTRGNSNTVSP